MKPIVALVFAAAFDLAGAALAAPEHHSTGVIPKFVGDVDSADAPRFLNSVIGQTDKIIGLQITVEPSTDVEFEKKGYLALKDNRLFSVSFSPPGQPGQSGGMEMVVPKDEVGWLNGAYTLDGFYVVKSGGMHQGTISVGLEKVDETAVLLSPKFRVIERVIR